MKNTLKVRYIPILISILFLIPVLTLLNLTNKQQKEEPIDPSYSTEEVVDNTAPVMNTSKMIINPYLDSSVKIGKNYYDYQGKEEEQEKAIIIHDNTYIQNTGIDYTSENPFEVVAILDGTISNIKEDEITGKTVEIKHDNGISSIYQSLSEVTVKKGDVVTQGQTIGKSGESELDKELGNHLHFEIYENGQSVNPSNYLNKEIKNKDEN